MGVMPAPRVTATPGCYILTWALAGVQVDFQADHLKSHTDGRLQARVRITVTLPDESQMVPHHGALNLAAGRSRREVSRALEERLPREGLNWDQVIEESCRLILEHEEEGSPVEPLMRVASIEVEYLLRPLLLHHLPVVWYAPGGSGKSWLAMYAALLVQNGLHFHDESALQANTLYLDWEVTKEEAGRRCTMLAKGLQCRCIGAELHFPLYRRCTASIQDEASEIAKAVAKHSVGLLIVDSAGPACGGDVMSGELAIQLFNTLRKVAASTNAAVLILTHTTKADRREENQRRLPIGSVYFENLPRATWEIRPHETGDRRVLELGMFPRKQNMARPEPVGLRLSFERDAVIVDTTTADDVLTEQGATRGVILAELAQGQASIAELVEATGAAASTVRWHLMKLSGAGKVESVSRGVYRLVEG